MDNELGGSFGWDPLGVLGEHPPQPAAGHEYRPPPPAEGPTRPLGIWWFQDSPSTLNPVGFGKGLGFRVWGWVWGLMFREPADRGRLTPTRILQRLTFLWYKATDQLSWASG